MKRIASFFLFIFLSFTVLAGCAGPPTETKQLDEPQKIEVAEAEKQRDEPAKNEMLERERRIDQIRLSLVERELIGENDKVYQLKEEIDLSERNISVLEGNKYYVVLPRMRSRFDGSQPDRKFFTIGVNIFGEKNIKGNRFPRDSEFGILVDDEVVALDSSGSISTSVRTHDLKTNVRYNFQVRDNKIVEKIKKQDVILLFQVAGRKDIIVLLKEDIDWDTS